MDQEKWQVIPENNHFEISSNGRIRLNRAGFKKILTQTLVNNYQYFSIKGKMTSISYLVARAFVPNPENKTRVGHLDRISCNNCSDNLYWAPKITKKEVLKSKLTEGQVEKVKNMLKADMLSNKEISEYFTVKTSTIIKVEKIVSLESKILFFQNEIRKLRRLIQD